MHVIRLFLFLPFLFIFMPAFVIFINEKSHFGVFTVFIVIGYFILMLLLKKQLLSKAIFVFKHTIFKYFMFLYEWIIFSSICAVCCGYYSFTRFFTVVIFNFIFKNILTFLYPIFVIPKIFSIKKIVQIFVIMYFFICIWGLLEFIGVTFNIGIVNILVHIFSNIRDVEFSIIVEGHTNIARIRSVFMEPSWFAKFISINLPLIYTLVLSKYRIFKNKYFNLITKICLIPLCVICLFLTQSPIFIIIAGLITIVYFYKEICKFIFKNIVIIGLMFILLICFNNVIEIDLSDTFLNRIIRFIDVLPYMNIDTLIKTDPSLAKRVIDAIVQIHLFIQHPFIGLGYGNNGIIPIKYFLNSGIPMTQEHLIGIMSSKTIIFANNALTMLLYQTGLIGFVLYVIFMLKNINSLKKIEKSFHGIENIFVKSLISFFSTYLVISIIYEQAFNDEFLFFMCGISIAINIVARKRLKKELELNER